MGLGASLRPRPHAVSASEVSHPTNTFQSALIPERRSAPVFDLSWQDPRHSGESPEWNALSPDRRWLSPCLCRVITPPLKVCYAQPMIRLLHEALLWACLAAIMGTCLYFDFPAGLLVAGAGVFWLACVLRREEQ